ncbi:hypothetical protein M2210_005871 [Bradyrhizobium elkanii]|jgi:hypothetical protein|nr:hypothetical protein [Bradyrhizobium elkanii]
MAVADASTSPMKRTSPSRPVSAIAMGVFQLRDVDSDKCFPIICHGSSCRDEGRLGTPE